MLPTVDRQRRPGDEPGILPAEEGDAARDLGTIIDEMVRAAGKSIDPANVAKIILPERWQRALGQVRSTAVGMARAGQVVILRHNKPADPDTFKGVYRLRLPMEGEGGIKTKGSCVGTTCKSKCSFRLVVKCCASSP